jgi:hypothetical protein
MVSDPHTADLSGESKCLLPGKKELYIMAGRSQERCGEGFWCTEKHLAVS